MSVKKTKASITDIGKALSEGLADAIRQFANAPRGGNRGLPVLEGLLAFKAVFTAPQDNVVLDAIDILNRDGGFYTFGNQLVHEHNDFGGRRLMTISTGTTVEAGVEFLLANRFTCNAGETDFPPPRWFSQLLLRSDLLPSRLPRILHFANRPVFDADYNLLPPGWHEASQTLVHGPHVDPVRHEVQAGDRPALDRLPPRLRTLLAGFCFESDADLVNALAALLTGLLGNKYVGVPKGLFLIDGNQPGLGKTLLVRVCGLVLDGEEPFVIAYTDNEDELQKRMGAQFRAGGSSIVLIDNAKRANGSAISSAVLESNCVAPEMSFRILGKSEIIKRPNDVVWMLTMNTTRVSSDLMSRGVPVRLSYSGSPEGRNFDTADPAAYARANRVELLGELAGMVVQWNQRGRPRSSARHRCHEWAAVVGGILEAAGFPEFLSNYRDAAEAFDTRLEAVGSLADAALSQPGGPIVEVAEFGGSPVRDTVPPPATRRLPAADWQGYFEIANVLKVELDEAISPRSRAIKIGQFLGACVDREVQIQRGDRSGRVRLRIFHGRSGRALYLFEVIWDDGGDESAGAVGSARPNSPVTPPARARQAAAPGAVGPEAGRPVRRRPIRPSPASAT